MRCAHATTAWLLLSVAGFAVPAAAQDAAAGYAQTGYDTDGQSVDTIAVFFEPLSHYGRWLDGRYGREWAPNVSRDWRPYTIGHWEAGAYGQTWRSDEPFGWAVFHFGRWAYDPPVGWVWLPDTVWGPGWVAWRDGDDVVGWTPLPPQVNALVASGDGFNDWGYDQWYQPGWIYVPRAYLYTRSLRRALWPYSRNRDAWGRTRGVTHYDRRNGQVFDRSFGDGRSVDGHDGGRLDLRGTPPLRTPPSGAGDAGGFIPLPHGQGDGFIPGSPPRGFDRRAMSQVIATGRPVMPPAHGPGPPAGGPPAAALRPPPHPASPPPHPHAANERPR